MSLVRESALALRRDAADALLRHARDELPNECCGLLIGDGRLIVQARRARNLRPAPDRYLVDPADHCAALRAARASGLRVVGAYHSHPDGSPRPSATDRREALYDEFVYLIVALRAGAGAAPGLAAYRPTRGGFEELALAVVP